MENNAKRRKLQGTNMNGDGITNAGELSSLSSLGIMSISISGQAVNATTPQGNFIRDYASYTRSDGTFGGAYDVVFATDQTDTVYRGESGAPSWSAAAIDVKGFGSVTNLAVATANDFDLADAVKTAGLAMATTNVDMLAVQASGII